MMNDQIERAATYRENAGTWRRLASQIRFDLCRRQQLGALAGAFAGSDDVDVGRIEAEV